MTAWRYIAASLRQYRRIHAAVAAGVAVATAVIAGALLVGDSVRGSLRDLALESLGRVDAALLAEHPFRQELAREWSQTPALADASIEATPLLLSHGAATFRGEDDETRRAGSLQIYGVPPEFWSFSALPCEPPLALARNDAAISESVARELNVGVGDAVLFRLPTVASLPADSTLGEKEETSAARRFKVAAILAEHDAGNMARFSLRPTQQAPRNAFVRLEDLQGLLDLSGKVNALALTGSAVNDLQPPSDATLSKLKAALHPTLADFGLQVEEVARPASPYIRISADRLVLPPHAVDVTEQLFGADVQPVVTYLANAITAGDRRVPYSTIAGVDSTADLGPVLDAAGEPVSLADDEAAVNDWTARELDVAVGDEIALTWYDPETTHGQLRELPPLKLKVRAILPLDDDGPTAAADPNFAPELPGVTDQASIDDWDLPFELVEKVRDEDEAYWDEHRTTPKVFVAHRLAARLWGSRWGTESILRLPIEKPSGSPLSGTPARGAGGTTEHGQPEVARAQGVSQNGQPTKDSENFSLRLGTPGRGAGGGGAPPELTVESVASGLRDSLDPAKLGMTFLAAKQNALAAASGTTPFDGLFLGFSFFLMASAVMLVALLYRLGIEQRAREVGLLLAVGFGARRLRRLLIGEGLIVAAIGAAIGAAAGVAYARLMVHGLNTWWVDATAAPFLELHVTPRSLAIGFASGLLVALLTIAWSLRSFARLPARQLLAGEIQSPSRLAGASRWSAVWLPLLCLAGAVAAAIAAVKLEGEAQAGAFFAGGALVLIGALAAIRGKLREPIGRGISSFSLPALAVASARRNPNRTMLALALAACASFLIVALGSFRLAPTDRGTGGFDLIATSSLPILFDLNTAKGRTELAFTKSESNRLANVETLAFRVHDGEDASCLNLYQTSQPRVLGAPPAIADNDRFAWAAHNPLPANGAARGRNSEPQSPWMLLDTEPGNDEHENPIVPVILDRNTAYYSLKLYGLGKQLVIRDSANRPVTLEVVGLLANSILQGDLIVSEANFARLFPEDAGRRFFLIRDSALKAPGSAGGPHPSAAPGSARRSHRALDTVPVNDANPRAKPGAELATLLETQLEDFGFDAVDARGRLADLMAVQNTYLSTFQSLGALGLLLGVVGLAVVQLRSVFERRGELALMQATGFRRRRLAALVLAENLVLLLGGLGIGCLAAIAAVLPHAIVQQARAPWLTLAILLAIVAVAGAIAAWLASRTVLRAPLLPALRGD